MALYVICHRQIFIEMQKLFWLRQHRGWLHIR